MELFSLLLLIFVGIHLLRGRERAARVALLGGFLSRYQIEKLMEALTDGYLRALGEQDGERRAQIWALLATTEKNLVLQLESLAQDFAKVAAQDARVSRLPLALPYASRWWPAATLDMRALLQLHARGMAAVAADGGDGSPEARKQQAYTMTAELYLLQHSCQWFCRSATAATVRLMALHQTGYEQVLAGVSRSTRDGYRQLTGI